MHLRFALAPPQAFFNTRSCSVVLIGQALNGWLSRPYGCW
jgi:hypothetical protein